MNDVTGSDGKKLPLTVNRNKKATGVINLDGSPLEGLIARQHNAHSPAD